MAYTEQDYQSFKENMLEPEDTFRFTCAMCGSCCRKRKEPILITGADIFRIAQALDQPMSEVIEKRTVTYVGDSSHVPVVVLRERDDGSCSLLRKGRCMVQQSKPAVCALFPLGRLYDVRDNSFHYFYNVHSCGSGKADGRVWTLQEWLDEFHLEETAPLTEAWNSLLMGLAQVACKMPKEKIENNELLLRAMFGALYLGFDTQKPFIPQVEQRKTEVKEVFARVFHMKIKY